MVGTNNGHDVITDFDLTADTLDLSEADTDYTDLSSLLAGSIETTVGGENGVLINTGTGSLFLEGITLADLAADDFIF